MLEAARSVGAGRMEQKDEGKQHPNQGYLLELSRIDCNLCNWLCVMLKMLS